MKNFIMWIVILFMGFLVIRFTIWLIFSRVIETDKSANKLCFCLKELIGGQWSKRPKPVFVMGEFEGKYRGREVIYKVIQPKFPLMLSDEVYLLLRPNFSSSQSASAPSMSFHFALRSYPQPTEYSYLKGDWLIYKPQLSQKITSAGEYYMDKERLIQALEELTRAAEIVESGDSREDRK